MRMMASAPASKQVVCGEVPVRRLPLSPADSKTPFCVSPISSLWQIELRWDGARPLSTGDGT